jgi:predicted dehydrogenase
MSLTSKYDYANAIFHFEDGSTASLTVGRNSTEEVRELELNSEKGAIKVDLFNCVYLQTEKLDNDVNIRKSSYEKRDHLLIEHLQFYESITNEASPIVSLQDGREAVYLVEMALKAIDTKQTISL